jgi:hypothetical protein
MDSNLQIITVLDKYLAKYQETIVKWDVAEIIYPSASHKPINLFPKVRTNLEIRRLGMLVPDKEITVKDTRSIHIMDSERSNRGT